MSKQFLAVLAAIIIVLVGIVVVTNHNRPSSSGSTAQATQHTEGSTSSGVTLVEYGDYQCPVCGTFYPAVKQVAAQYNSKIIFQFRNLPLTSLHPNAYAAARAAEAASLQGKFWEMHDMLYEQQTSWASSNNPLALFDTYAKGLGLNTTQFNQDYASEKVNQAINADMTAFNKTGDDEATPTFYLDGKKLNNVDLLDSTSHEPSVAAFSKVIDAEIAKKLAASHK